MSFVYDPANDRELLVKDARYSSRALWFSWTAAVVSVIGLFVIFVLPIAFAFTYLALRNSIQAQQEGFRYNQFTALRLISMAPFAAVAGLALYLVPTVMNDTSGWASLGILLVILFSLPAILVANIIGFFTTRSLRKRDQVGEPRGASLMIFRVIGYVSFVLTVFALLMGGFGFMASFI